MLTIELTQQECQLISDMMRKPHNNSVHIIDHTYCSLQTQGSYLKYIFSGYAKSLTKEPYRIDVPASEVAIAFDNLKDNQHMGKPCQVIKQKFFDACESQMYHTHSF